jgi:hypothetical protein
MKGGADTAAIEVYNMSVLAAGEDNTPVEGIAALRVDETSALQRHQGVALIREMTPQISAGGIADPEFFDQGGFPHAALFEIASRFRVMPRLPLAESGSLLQHVSRFSGRGLPVNCRKDTQERSQS